MPDEPKNGITKPEAPLQQKRKIGLTGLQARVAAAKHNLAVPAEMPNRISLQLDCSSSMSSGDYYSGNPNQHKIDQLKEAVEGFLRQCNWNDTAISIVCFPQGIRVQLSCDGIGLAVAAQGLEASGGTPMAVAMRVALEEESITRAVLISDGEADSHGTCLDIAAQYREAKIPIDCVHIGSSSDGEELLRQIASLTGGTYLKFKDAAKLIGALKYLTPALRGYLTAGVAKELGADEIK